MNRSNIYIIKELIKIIEKKKIKIGNKVKIKYVKDRPGHDFRYALDSSKLKKRLNWKPKTSLSKGLTKTIEWYLDNQEFFSSISKKLFTKRLGLR